MKRNKVLKIIAIVLAALLTLLLVAGLGVFLYFRHLMSSLPEVLPDAADSTAQVTLTDDELDKLLGGEITLDDLIAGAKADSTTEEDASASVPQQDAASSVPGGSADSETAGSAGTQEPGGTSGSSSGSTPGASASSGTSASSGKTEQPYEAEVKALIRQLYSVKARAEAELNSCVAGAKAEYKALPESQQTQARKMSIVLSRSSRLYAMQASYDKEVEGIVSQMRTVLKANGQSTELADQAMASYKAQKNAAYSRLVAELYS